ncbi:uncharacterized protein LOC111675861 [Lucilia cuprina]|uniref:uncharacterized protein LOC111675861 n=1 Tax=Lucilia cuprina TaxID=7375 RepID=UPI000C71A13A|nr:uncharacterized protein LOC111675861 [Lucilia cuprina]KAI8130461.1 hypothetical protein CVS40_0124 [Lucilia cuprina]
MFKFNKLFVLTLIALIAIVASKNDALEITDVEKDVQETRSAEAAVLKQLKVIQSKSDESIYTYKCTVGTNKSNRLICTAHDNYSWNSTQNVELKLRCPKSGSGPTVSYVEIDFAVSSPSVNCHVHEGSIGSGYIGVTVNAWSTLIFNYLANFYTNQ